MPDDIEEIRAAVRECTGDADVLILTGGTGLGPRDVTPQALVPLFDYEVPGMAEVMRHQGMESTPHAMLSRQVVGVTGELSRAVAARESRSGGRVPRRGVAGAAARARAALGEHAAPRCREPGELGGFGPVERPAPATLLVHQRRRR